MAIPQQESIFDRFSLLNAFKVTVTVLTHTECQ